MRRPSRRVLCTVLLALLVVPPLAGCVSDDPTAKSFAEADVRFSGEADDPHVFEVPSGNVTLVIAVHYVLAQEATFKAVIIVQETGTHLAAIDQVGPVEEHDPRWATIRNATAGTWRLDTEATGDTHYTFGVFFEERRAQASPS